MPFNHRLTRMPLAKSFCRYNSASRVNDISQHKFSVAPMMDFTDCHQRYFQRLLTSKSVLYTEMVTTNSLVHSNDTDGLLRANFCHEEPLVLQVGGSCPQSMKQAATIAREYGYSQININSGCPSPRVAGAGCFGAALMVQPHIVASLSLSVGEVTGRPATVKCRIGVDNEDSYEQLANYVRIVNEVGKVSHFIIHARKALLGAKFSPADNRKIPPLVYPTVYRLIQDFPSIDFSINGGIVSYEDCDQHFNHGVAGVMVGRAAINDPFYWSGVDSYIYGDNTSGVSRREVMSKYIEYCAMNEGLNRGCNKRSLIKPVLNIFTGKRNGRLFRSTIDALFKTQPDLSAALVLEQAMMTCIDDEVLDSVQQVPSKKQLFSDRPAEKITTTAPAAIFVALA